ncbi:coiled-coil domain-containing protein 102A-like [Myripristis murdjan]|uniref:coiled-coil domain-containing protein 102A-like n=1 Tax=Myripristis murdjan TaxID=586833 RepID=UPI0011763128|nr:coiled-coil domain-containing protein 102A-like [Myripristis murdjan]
MQDVTPKTPAGAPASGDPAPTEAPQQVDPEVPCSGGPTTIEAPDQLPNAWSKLGVKPELPEGGLQKTEQSSIAQSPSLDPEDWPRLGQQQTREMRNDPPQRPAAQSTGGKTLWKKFELQDDAIQETTQTEKTPGKKRRRRKKPAAKCSDETQLPSQETEGEVEIPNAWGPVPSPDQASSLEPEDWPSLGAEAKTTPSSMGTDTPPQQRPAAQSTGKKTLWKKFEELQDDTIQETPETERTPEKESSRQTPAVKCSDETQLQSQEKEGEVEIPNAWGPVPSTGQASSLEPEDWPSLGAEAETSQSRMGTRHPPQQRPAAQSSRKKTLWKKFEQQDTHQEIHQTESPQKKCSKVPPLQAEVKGEIPNAWVKPPRIKVEVKAGAKPKQPQDKQLQAAKPQDCAVKHSQGQTSQPALVVKAVPPTQLDKAAPENPAQLQLQCQLQTVVSQAEQQADRFKALEEEKSALHQEMKELELILQEKAPSTTASCKTEGTTQDLRLELNEDVSEGPSVPKSEEVQDTLHKEEEQARTLQGEVLDGEVQTTATLTSTKQKLEIQLEQAQEERLSLLQAKNNAQQALEEKEQEWAKKEAIMKERIAQLERDSTQAKKSKRPGLWKRLFGASTQKEGKKEADSPPKGKSKKPSLWRRLFCISTQQDD